MSNKEVLNSLIGYIDSKYEKQTIDLYLQLSSALEILDEISKHIVYTDKDSATIDIIYDKVRAEYVKEKIKNWVKENEKK